MPEANLAAFSLEGLTPSELEQRRRNIITKYSGPSGASADPLASLDDMTIEDLRELAALTSALRRRTAGPPKAKTTKKEPATPKKDIQDVLNLLS